jgi:hypothetical protein
VKAAILPGLIALGLIAPTLILGYIISTPKKAPENLVALECDHANGGGCLLVSIKPGYVPPRPLELTP